MSKITTLGMLLLLAAGLISGCAKKADANKPLEQIQAEVQTMSTSDLEKTAQAYAQEIEAKMAEADKVAAQLKELSPTEIFSEKAKNIKGEVDLITTNVTALKDRYSIYANKYKELGGDINKIKIA